MKQTIKLTALASIMLVSACSDTALKPIDYADAGTTALIVAQGGVEANAVIGAAGNATAPIVSLGVKYGLRAGLPAAGFTEPQADALIDTASWIGTCNNIAVLTGAAAFPASLGFGAICGAASFYSDRDAFEGFGE